MFFITYIWSLFLPLLFSTHPCGPWRVWFHSSLWSKAPNWQTERSSAAGNYPDCTQRKTLSQCCGSWRQNLWIAIIMHMIKENNFNLNIKWSNVYTWPCILEFSSPFLWCVSLRKTAHCEVCKLFRAEVFKLGDVPPQGSACWRVEGNVWRERCEEATAWGERNRWLLSIRLV